MKKFWKILNAVMLCVLLGGCGEKTPGSLRVVDRVEIACDHAYGISRWNYTQPEKVGQVLNYLRLQEGTGWTETDPERVAGDVYRIDVCLSDGSHRIYYQRAGKYFSKRCHTWQKTDPEKAAALAELLRKTPSDQ